MTFDEFNALVTRIDRPVILVEGTRDLPEHDVAILVAFAKWLADTYPHAVFRTGNAKGSDEAFASGITGVDPTRLEYVLPYGGHRKNAVASQSYQIPFTEMSRVAEDRAVYHTSQASPEYTSMMDKRDTVPKLRSKARYILRDTIKVIGAEGTALKPATAGIFYVNRDDPMKGGTGHTIRVCEKQGVPVAFQDEWINWPSG